ncbi:hypothetical protein F511_12575 [Dorcoceras hygrometricum]|uniref:Uncharacterized protein n=1 Tax=Dorcoceras hygrometricum TaxID=472368 RepID=A0A2Z7B563_9LAMI|nr:hypothetical protein F511_12575 [Dorcoceras hygrometricum]
MASSRFVNALQVEFESVLTLEHTGMTRMFKSLEDTGLKGFMEVPTSVYKDDVTEFLVNAKVIAGTIVSFVCNQKMVINEDVFSTTFRRSTEGMIGFLDILKYKVMEMHSRFSEIDVSFRAPSEKREMKVEYRLLHDIFAKSLCTKAGSFDTFTSQKFELMVVISARLTVSWGKILFRVLLGMVNNPKKQSQGFGCSKSVQTYIKKNFEIKPAGVSSKQTVDTASNTEGGESQRAKPVVKETRAAEKEKEMSKTKKRATTEADQRKKKKMVPIPSVDAGIKNDPEVSGDKQVDDGPGGNERTDSEQDEAAAIMTWILVVGVLAHIQLLRVISCWYVSCDDQQRALRDSEATTFCEQEPAVGFVSVFRSG